MTDILTVSNLQVRYGSIPAVRGVDLVLQDGGICVVLGPNGAGKTTIVKALMGLIPKAQGRVTLGGRDISSLPPHKIAAAGVGWVPEGRKLWDTLTVMENLRLAGLVHRNSARTNEAVTTMLARFPRLGERRNQVAGSLSGGEQQMLAIARALVLRPKVILMDEPSLGLAPLLVRQVFDLITAIRDEGISILLVEQNARRALQVADSAYLLELGVVVAEGPADQIAKSTIVSDTFLGGPPRKRQATSTPWANADS
jgi:branched-chain amino acid transport system ATP-binding protein